MPTQDNDLLNIFVLRSSVDVLETVLNFIRNSYINSSLKYSSWGNMLKHIQLFEIQQNKWFKIWSGDRFLATL